METRRRKEAVVKEMTPEGVKRVVRRSSRSSLVPKRLTHSPATNAPNRKQNIKKASETKNQNNKKEIEDAENTDAENSSGVYGQLSEYELERLEKIRQNQAFLSSISLLQASEELKQLKRPPTRGLTRLPTAVKEVLPPRKSLRLQRKEADVFIPPPESKSSPVKCPPGPLPMEAINMEEGSKLPSELVELWSEDLKEERRTQPHLERYCASLKNMRLTEDRVAKVVTNRIYCAAFHPCCSSLLMAAGDTSGKVGLWKLGGDWADDGVLLYQPHSGGVACMAFSCARPTHLLSCSFDGSLRSMDVEKAVFDDVYVFGDALKTFDFMSHDCSTLVVGNVLGDIAIVDRRTPGNSHESLHSVNPKTLRSVNVHPVHKQYFVVAESRTVNIYDSRCLKKTKNNTVSELHGHQLSTTSAYFSPCTGNRVLTSCTDDHIRIFDTSRMIANSPLLTSVRQNMQTGRWVTKISAVWDPKQEGCFVAGSMLKPRRVQVFHENGWPQHTFIDEENLKTVLPVTAFHPTRNALLGGSSSGRLHVFCD